MKGFLSFPTIFISALIIGIAPWARRILKLIYSIIGRDQLCLWLKIIFLITIFIGILYILSRAKKAKISLPSFFLLLPFLPFAFLFLKIKLPEEKIHLIEYALLGLLVYKDFFKGRIKLYLSILFLLIVASLDEIFQLILPDRIFDYRDIFFNSLGGFTGFSYGRFLSLKNEIRSGT